MRMRAGVISTPRRLKLSRMGASARSSTSMPTPNALAMELAVMSSWVGPMPPVVNT